ncbi:MAG: hypothetical protein ACKOXT_05900 [Actinomycetota bacterium]
MEIQLAKRAILNPLIGLVIGWVMFMFAIYSDLFIYPVYDKFGSYVGEAQVVRPSTYLFLAGITVFGIASLFGQRMALHAREIAGPDQPLARAAHRFTNLTVIISLVGGAIFAIGNFLSAFNQFGNREDNLGLRFLQVYLPILLATALVVFILLRAFVFRKSTVKGQKREGLSETEKALGFGYAIPVIFTAVAIIFGLVVYDATRTELQVWVWVVIQAIIAIGILLGTRFSAKARSAKVEAPRPRQTLAAGASNLNFVLSIVFGGVVSVMSFTFGAGAIDKLRIWPEYQEGTPEKPVINTWAWQVAPFSFDWFIREMFPALMLLLLAAVGIYLFITERNKLAPVAPSVATSSALVKATKPNGTKASANGTKPAGNGNAKKINGNGKNGGTKAK